MKDNKELKTLKRGFCHYCGGSLTRDLSMNKTAKIIGSTLGCWSKCKDCGASMMDQSQAERQYAISLAILRKLT